MIKEAYCSYEVCKLLKEKGFYGQCHNFAEIEDMSNGEKWNKKSQKTLSIPTQQMAMRWLREVHKLSATIGFGNGLRSTCFYMSIVKMEPGAKHLSATMRFETYEEAVEAALKYCLENLIKEG